MHIPKAECVLEWLRAALTTTAHGFDLEIPGAPTPYDVDRQLLAWEQTGWISRGVFAPDLSQRALSIVPPYLPATLENAKKRLQEATDLGSDFFQSSFWWLPGPNAAEVLARLPAPRPLGVGEKVRYRRGFLRSIGMSNDDAMLRWSGRISEMRSFSLVFCTQEAAPCSCGLGKKPPDPECFRCSGTGQTTLLTVHVKNIERVDSGHQT